MAIYRFDNKAILGRLLNSRAGGFKESVLECKKSWWDTGGGEILVGRNNAV